LYTSVESGAHYLHTHVSSQNVFIYIYTSLKTGHKKLPFLFYSTAFLPSKL